MTAPRYDANPTEPFQPPASAPAQGSVPPPPAPGTQPAPPAPGSLPVTEPVTPSVAARSAGRGGGSSRLLNLALGAALVIGAAGVAFAAGRATAPAAAATGGGTATLPGGGTFGGNGSFPGRGYFPGGGYFGGNGGRGLFGGGGLTIEGTVDSVSADSVTIKLASGQTITVGLNSDTTYHQQAAASASDVQAGKSVILRLTGGFRADGNGGTPGTTTLGTASDVTVVP